MKSLKKEQSLHWLKKYELAFNGLKIVVLEEPILKLLNYNKLFKVHMDTSNFTIGGMLMQENQSMVNKSLNKTDR